MKITLIINAARPSERIVIGSASTCTIGLIDALISAMNNAKLNSASTLLLPITIVPGKSQTMTPAAMVSVNQRPKKCPIQLLCTTFLISCDETSSIHQTNSNPSAIMGIMILHLHVVRHGQTYFNRYNRLQGWSNSPLTQSGYDDAEKAAEKLKMVSFSAAFCSDTTRAETTASIILAKNIAHKQQPNVVHDMHFREQFYGYFEGQDMATSWWAAGAPHGAGSYNAIVERFGLAATKNFLKEADPFHDAESDAEYWERIEGGFALIAAHPGLQDGDHILLISHGNSLLSIMHRFAPTGYDLSERPSNGSVTRLDFDTSRNIAEAIAIVSYNQ